MADRPILFSGPMVRALLAGTKTQTRRLIRPQPYPATEARQGVVYGPIYANDWIWPNSVGYTVSNRPGGPLGIEKALPIQAGDRLWVRESFFLADAYLAAKTFTGGSYKADTSSPAELQYTGWRPSIHMPRWASRLTLHVTDVRVHRLHEMSDDDIRAEGISDTDTSWLNAWHQLWAGINGEPSWEANPWVAAYTFSVEHANIDQARVAA